MKVQFVTRSNSGDVVRGGITEGAEVTVVSVTRHDEISFNIRQSEIYAYHQDATDLKITLADGRVILLENYFEHAGNAQVRLFISADGYINEVTLVNGYDGTLYAQYGPTEIWGKWSPSDDLIFLDSAEIISPTAEADEENVSMLGTGLLGGTGIVGTAGMGAAGLAASSLLTQGANGSSSVPSGIVTPGSTIGNTRIEPTLNETDQIIIGGDQTGTDGGTITISGEAFPGSTVTVQIGDKTAATNADSDGNWQIVFEPEALPEDGSYDVIVVVTDPDGKETQLDGPKIIIDTTPPDIEVLEGTLATGHVVNRQDYLDGIEISGRGESGATVSATVDTAFEDTIVNNNGEWSIEFEPSNLLEGDYEASILFAASDTNGNTTKITDAISIDTIHPELTINGDAVGYNGLLNSEAAGYPGLIVRGTAESGSIVTVSIADQRHEVATGEDGVWQAAFDPYALPGPEYNARITATTQDAAGNASQASASFRMDLEVLNFSQEGKVGGDDNVISSSEIDEGFVLTGTVEPGSEVTLSFLGENIEAEVERDGTWAAQVDGEQISKGNYTSDLVIKAKDPANNISILNREITVDTEAGSLTLNADAIGNKGVINLETYNDGIMVTGTSDPNAEVEVYVDDVQYIIEADHSGFWKQFYDTVDLTPGVHTPVVSATIRDDHGNIASQSAEVLVDTRIDDLTITTPNFATNSNRHLIINGDIAREGFEIAGTVEPGAIVWINIDGVRRLANDDGNGNWTATFGPGSIRGGQRETNLTAEVEDSAGNFATIEKTILVDTVVQNISQGETSGAVNGVANLEAALAGLELTGTAEAGSEVRVSIFNGVYNTISDTDGNWTITIPEGDVPLQETSAQATITVKDRAGNIDSIPGVVAIDMVAPDHPEIVGYFREGGGYRYLTTKNAQDTVTIHEIEASGDVRELALYVNQNPLLMETDHIFLNDTGQVESIPDGSQLVVTSTDPAQNTSSTYVVLDEVNTSVVDPASPNLASFQVQTINLRFADQSEMTITEEQLRELSDISNTLTIEGGSDDTVILVNAQTVKGTTDTPPGFDIYTLGKDAMIIVDDDIEIVT